MKLKFDSNQSFQIAAVESITNLFDGQALNPGDFSVEIDTAGTSGQGSIFQSELGIGNNLILDHETILKNLNRLQEINELDLTSEKEFGKNGLNFSVEMETGTGKTYVYLRTIFELSQKYGFKKFIIVVPSVAIREGALKNIEITHEHFKALYNNMEFEHFVYDSKKANRLRQFATSNHLQIMVINIDAFRKDFSDSEDDKKSNVIFKESDKLSGRRPIKIMRNKEQLLSPEEPLKFIFSHSALREGWDNPNVFQICTLNETNSVMKKRQEIGRGLRLPVNQNGERVFDDNINKLTIIANERYDDFARKLQTEYEEDCGVTFGKVPKIGFARIVQIVNEEEITLGRSQSEKVWEELVNKGFLDENGKIKPSFNPQQPGFTLGLSGELKEIEAEVVAVLQSYQIERHIKRDEASKMLCINKQVFLDPAFEELWNRIKFKTTYEVNYSTEDLITASVKAIRQMDKIEPIQISYKEAQLDVGQKGVTTQETRSNYLRLKYSGVLPDIIAYLQKETELTRRTLVNILTKSGRLEEFAINPQKFMDAVGSIISRELHRIMIDGIKYERIAEQEWSMRLFEDEEILSYLSTRLEVKKSVYDAVVYDSEVERKFAEDLDRREDIKLFVKLPRWFVIETPIGSYNPDWAVVKKDDATVYLVRETKGTKDFEKLRNAEADRIRCGRKHFNSLKVDFAVAVSSGDV